MTNTEQEYHRLRKRVLDAYRLFQCGNCEHSAFASTRQADDDDERGYMCKLFRCAVPKNGSCQLWEPMEVSDDFVKSLSPEAAEDWRGYLELISIEDDVPKLVTLAKLVRGDL